MNVFEGIGALRTLAGLGTRYTRLQAAASSACTSGLARTLGLGGS